MVSSRPRCVAGVPAIRRRSHYKLDNSPFYAYGVSWEDVVSAPFESEEGFPTFKRVVSKSGNRTVRVIFETPFETGKESDRVLQGLVALGCSYEGANRKYVSVNVPPGVDLTVVRSYLIEQGARWEHADPTYAASGRRITSGCTRRRPRSNLADSKRLVIGRRGSAPIR